MDKALDWYGVQTVGGHLHTRRILDGDTDIAVAKESNRNVAVYGPITATSRQLATKELKAMRDKDVTLQRASKTEEVAEDATLRLKRAIYDFSAEVGEDRALEELDKGLYEIVKNEESRTYGRVTIVNNHFAGWPAIKS